MPGQTCPKTHGKFSPPMPGKVSRSTITANAWTATHNFTINDWTDMKYGVSVEKRNGPTIRKFKTNRQAHQMTNRNSLLEQFALKDKLQRAHFFKQF
ncbi:4572_t:CDS:2 [Diversispora eburnea]|uniref:4572_t:CDS:1 n=1 Tax=Diversispora eburnea TaxID=1213867 RepID=A0A9N9AMI3_9GLOM|nr:4572_t:CDS:2 [Diversispora eburnea]